LRQRTATCELAVQLVLDYDQRAFVELLAELRAA
jgi:hypothetical protein